MFGESHLGKILLLITLIGICLVFFFHYTETGVEIRNHWTHNLQKADDATNYDTLKKVEDTCRAMISSYKSDKLAYEQYKDSSNEEKQSWAEQAKMRANKTATSYNNYIMENSFLWKDGIPRDIYVELEIIE